MMISTIQLREDVKRTLERLKQRSESYEDVIVKLINESEKKKLEQEKLLIEGYREMAEDSLRITKEWESTDAKIEWEWDEN